jgi:rhomboid protease GluP
MKNEISFKDKDMLVMKLLHYFITEKGYNPILLHGVQDEIWLENMESPYRIVRIMTGYIHNNNQYDFDMFKTQKIMQKIKLKTFTFKLNTLSLFLDLGDYVDLESTPSIDCVSVNDEEDITKSDLITRVFPDIKKKLKFDEDGVELFAKITNDINEKNKKQAKESEEVLTIRKPIVTYALIAINILVFIAMYIFGKGSYDVNTLLDFGALSIPHVLINNEYYRLITSAFIHIGFLHIFMNMYALYILGPQLESFFGHIKYLIIYLFSALFASLVTMIFISPSTLSAGASGAIFGLTGAFVYFGYHYRAYLSNVLLRQIVPIILLNIIIGFTLSGINNAAHLGGLAGGLIISTAMGIKYKTSTFEKVNGWIVTILSVAFLIYMVFIK